MAIKKTLLEIVQEILNDMDSDSVNSISDTVESEQVASIVESVYYSIIATRRIPEHQELVKLTAASDTNFPTHFEYTDNVWKIEKVWYKNSDGMYQEVHWCSPMDFLDVTDGRQSDYDSVSDKQAGTSLRIANNKHPQYYTSFDDQWIVMDSYESTVDSTLQNSKVRAYGYVYPVFSQADAHTPDLDGTLFPFLIAESKSTAMSLLKGGSDPKVEQTARRQKSFMQNDLYRTVRENKRPKYGR